MVFALGLGNGVYLPRRGEPPVDGSIMPTGGKYIFSTRRVRAGYSGPAMQVARYYPDAAGDTSAVGTNTITGVTPTTHLRVGVGVAGLGIPAGARISSVVGDTIAITQNLVAGGGAWTVLVLGGSGDTVDLNYLSSGELDTPALTTFVGGGTGKVLRWHNQSDLVAGSFLVAVDNNRAPEVITGGVLHTINGLPAIRADGHEPSNFGNVFRIMATLSPFVEISAVWESADSRRGLFIEHSNHIGLSDGMILHSRTDPAWAMRRLGGTIHQYSSLAVDWVPPGSPACVQMRYAPDAQHVRLDGRILFPTATGGSLQSDVALTNDLYVLGRGSGGVYSAGKLGELIIWENGASPSRLAYARANSQIYWGTP